MIRRSHKFGYWAQPDAGQTLALLVSGIKASSSMAVAKLGGRN
jgi:hypothetical protein